tara:strand:- start:231 stop:341 length:111 start_codon:yes stop_codon:yes gene_type:complete
MTAKACPKNPKNQFKLTIKKPCQQPGFEQFSNDQDK